MRLNQYLAGVKFRESRLSFSKRAGVPYATVANSDMEETNLGMTLARAYAVVQATQAEPTPDGGFVTFEELVPLRFLKPKKKLRKARKRKVRA